MAGLAETDTERLQNIIEEGIRNAINRGEFSVHWPSIFYMPLHNSEKRKAIINALIERFDNLGYLVSAPAGYTSSTIDSLEIRWGRK